MAGMCLALLAHSYSARSRLWPLLATLPMFSGLHHGSLYLFWGTLLEHGLHSGIFVIGDSMIELQ